MPPFDYLSPLWLGVQRGWRVGRRSRYGWDEDDPGFEDAVRLIEDG